MEWYRRIQFVAAVAMAPEIRDAFGTTINGMWADPESLSRQEVADAHDRDRRVLFSVPMIALTPDVYDAGPTTYLLDEVCRDIDGAESECDWYFWEAKPVFAGCIYSEVFRAYLLARCRDGVDRGMDVVNLDEIMTGIGLMNRAPSGSGFCSRCLERYRSQLDARDPERALDDDALRARIKDDDDSYARYRAFHELAAFEVMTGFIRELRSYAAERNPEFTISANVGYLANLVPTFGALWGCQWGRHIDFVLMENHYRVEPGGPHLLLPRGSFAAWYRLGSSITGAPTWICPSITVPRQLADRPHTNYHLLMFLEAYANAGRWGYYWWPGVDAQTRLAATAPESLKPWIRFIDEHRELYEDAVTANELAILYADGAISRRPETHAKYLALAQAFAERGFQFDVLYSGDGRFNPEEIAPDALDRYRVIAVPEARDLGAAPAHAIEAFANVGDVVVFSESTLKNDRIRHADGDLLATFWQDYRDNDRDRILSELTDVRRIEVSDPAAVVTRYRVGDRHVLHLLDYRYNEITDAITPIHDLLVRIPWSASVASCSMLTLDGERELTARVSDAELIIEVPTLAPYALVVVQP